MPRLSPSSRRAWIEIFSALSSRTALKVALLAEGVDRNSVQASACASYSVALLAEGVDRNSEVDTCDEGVLGRPPRGGRG